MLEVLLIVFVSLIIIGLCVKGFFYFVYIGMKGYERDKERERLKNIMKKAEKDGLIPKPKPKT